MEICTWYQVLKFMVATDAVVRVSAGDVFAWRRASGMRFEGQIACGTAWGVLASLYGRRWGGRSVVVEESCPHDNRRMNGGALQEGLACSALVSRNSS
jgi:hypothetical protein